MNLDYNRIMYKDELLGLLKIFKVGLKVTYNVGNLYGDGNTFEMPCKEYDEGFISELYHCKHSSGRSEICRVCKGHVRTFTKNLRCPVYESVSNNKKIYRCNILGINEEFIEDDEFRL